MDFIIPKPLKVEHDELHVQLAKATKESGEIGEAAKKVAKVLHNHFVKEEEFATPPLGLLVEIAKGNITEEMKSVLDLTDKLKAELPQILEEHRLIKEALQNLIFVASKENKLEYVDFANKLILHAETEEEVFYPSAILIGEYLKQKFQ
ncbi:MAG: hypothetical protein AB1432_14035 [Bacteroidota bacterium]